MKWQVSKNKQLEIEYGYCGWWNLLHIHVSRLPKPEENYGLFSEFIFFGLRLGVHFYDLRPVGRHPSWGKV